MAETRTQRFSVTGVANVTTLDTGLTSNTDEKYHLQGIYLRVSGWVDNIIIGMFMTTKILDIPDYLVHTDESTASGNTQKSVTLDRYFDINLDIPVGQTFKIGIQCGGTAKNLTGSYVYQAMKV